MSTFAWFDISTTNNAGFSDALENDVLIRCLQPSQKFLFGATGELSSCIIKTDGTASLSSNLETPLITTDHIIPKNNYIQLANAVFVQGGNIKCESLSTVSFFTSNIEIHQGGYIVAGDFLKTYQYIESPVLYTDTINKSDSNNDSIQITDSVTVSSNLFVTATMRSKTIHVECNITSKQMVCTADFNSPTIYTSTLSNNNRITLQGVVFENRSLTGCNLDFSHCLTKSHTSVSINTTFLKSSNIDTYNIVNSLTDTIYVKDVKFQNGSVSCRDFRASNQCIIDGETYINNNIYISSNINIIGNVTSVNKIKCNDISSTRATIEEITTPYIKSENGNIRLNGVYISSNSNLTTSNAYFENTNTCNITSLMSTTRQIVVQENATTKNMTVSEKLSSKLISASNIETLFVNQIGFNACNVGVPGMLTTSNLTVGVSCIIRTGGSFTNNSPLYQYGPLICSNNLTCSMEVTTGSLKTMTIRSPGQKLYLDSVLIQSNNQMVLERITTNTLQVLKEANIGQAIISGYMTVNQDIRCMKTIYSDTFMGYKKPGDLRIENIQISDHDTMSLGTVNATNVNITHGSLVLKLNSTIVTDNNDVLVNTSGKIMGSCILPLSVTSGILGYQCVSSDKIMEKSILSSHLSSGLSFKGVSIFEDIVLKGTLTSPTNYITICGITHTNSLLGVGGVANPLYPLHVLGKSFVENRNYTTLTGLSNNIGIFSMKSSHIETPLLIKMSYNDLCTTSFQLATYPYVSGSFDVGQGDLLITTTDELGGASKIFINESIFISSSNVGIWKSNPLAPLHTTVFASDKIGIGGIVDPLEVLDVIGNITIKRDPMTTSCFLKISDTDQLGTMMKMKSDTRFFMYNELGDIIVNARDNDPSECSHIYVQQVTGYIGFGTPSPVSPLHINGKVRPGAFVADQTVLIESDSPSIKMNNSNSTCTYRIDDRGQYTFEQTSSLEPYVQLLGTDRRTFKRNGNIIVGATDNVVMLGPHTKLILFTERDQRGMHETLVNDSPHPVETFISGPSRKTNWTLDVKSMSISSTNYIVNKIVSDVVYTNPYGENVFYVENSLKLVGIGTADPNAAIDINSSFSSNVINYMGKCIFDTDYNLKNITGLSVKGPFLINGTEIFDTSNNLVGISNINYSSTLIHKGAYVLIDNDRNLGSIKSASITGPLNVGNKEVIDVNRNLSNLNNISLADSIVSNGHVFLDKFVNVKCSNMYATGDIKSKNYIGIDNAGFINNRNNAMTIAPLSKACFVDSLYNNVLTVDVLQNSVEMNGTLKHDGKTIISSFRSMSNINAISVYGPLVLNNKLIMTSEYAFDAVDVNIDNKLTHKGVMILDSNKNLSNISNISCKPPIYANGLVLLDAGMNLQNVVNTRTQSLTIQDVRFKCPAPNKLSIECDALTLNIKGRSLVEYGENEIRLNSECVISSIHTSLIESDAGMSLETNGFGLVSTNIGYKAPRYVFGDSLFSISSTYAGVNFLPSLSIIGPTKTLFEITTPSTTILNNVVIGAPKETTHRLCVGGTIYADDDIFCFSDKRDKTNIRKIGGALRKLRQITGVTYDRRGRQCTGVLAQDVMRVLPEAVFEDVATGNLSVAYGNMIGLLVESIKEINCKNRSIRILRHKRRVIRQ